MRAWIATYLLPVVITLTMVNPALASTDNSATAVNLVDVFIRTGVFWAALVVWGLSRFAEWRNNRREHERARTSLIRSLFAEINVNVIDLQETSTSRQIFHFWNATYKTKVTRHIWWLSVNTKFITPISPCSIT